jgi:hypothetical protein
MIRLLRAGGLWASLQDMCVCMSVKYLVHLFLASSPHVLIAVATGLVQPRANASVCGVSGTVSNWFNWELRQRYLLY